MAYVKHGFILPNINDPYVYLKTLKTDNNPMANITGESASSALSMIKNKLGDGRITESLTFLSQVAEKQRAHELAFIQNKINLLSNNKDGEIIKDLINHLENINNPEKFNYFDFIKALNGALQGLERYEQRIKGLSNNINSYKKGEPHNVEGVRNIVSDLTGTIGEFTGRRKEFNYSQEELIRQLIVKFFDTQIGKDILSKLVIDQDGDLKFAAILGIIQDQLAQYLYDNGKLNYTKQFYKDETEFLQELDRTSEYLKNFIKQYNFNNILSNNAYLQDAIELYGLTRLSRTPRPYTGKKAIEAQEKIANIRKTIENPLAQYEDSLLKKIKRIKVTYKSVHKLGLNAELRSIFSGSSGRHMGSFNTGTDVLLGQFIGTFPQSTRDPVAQTLDKIKFNMKDREAANNVKETSKIYEEAYKELHETLEKLQKGFILHESTKFYQTVEKGSWHNGKKGFHGRNMALLNYIDAIAQFGESIGIDTQWLKFAAYNLSDAALGSELKNPLQTYFSIAAGLIMFDDFSVIAKEVTEELNYSNVDVLHLYNLNGVYVPASYFLQQTYYYLTKSGDEISKGDAFKTYISAPKITYSRDKSKTMQTQWEEIKSAGSDVHISLVFGANFLNLIGNLMNP